MDTLFSILGWFATFYVLFAYLMSSHNQNPRIFHIANFWGSIVLTICNLYFGIYFAAFLSGSFGVIGAYALYKDHAF